MNDSDIAWQADMFQNEGVRAPREEGQDFTYDPTSHLTMPDVPDNYNNIAFHSIAENGYQLPEFDSCFQGTGLGGNGVYNGALYQEPANWWWDDDKVHRDIFLTDEDITQNRTVSEVLRPYFDRVRQELEDAIKTTPSMDGIHYNHGLYDLVRPQLQDHNFTEIEYHPGDPASQAANARLQEAGDRFFTVPTVNAKDGLRTGASAWIEKFMNENGEIKEEYPKLEIKTHTEVLKVNLDKHNEVTGVTVIEHVKGSKHGGKGYDKNWKTEPSNPDQRKTKFKVKKGGKVILSCNALPTNRILYRSGIGPEGEWPRA